MRKRTVLLVVIAVSAGIVVLCSCAIGIVALKYGPVLMKQAGVAEKRTASLDLLPPASLTVVNPSGDITLQTGDVTQVRVEAVAIAHSATEVWARRILAQVDLRSSSDGRQGRIEVVLPNPLLAQDPRVNLAITVPRDTTLTVVSQNGDIRVSLLPDSAFILDAQTERGRIECAFSLTDREERQTGGHEQGQWLKGYVRDGSGTHITLHARVGNITIEPLE